MFAWYINFLISQKNKGFYSRKNTYLRLLKKSNFTFIFSKEKRKNVYNNYILNVKNPHMLTFYLKSLIQKILKTLYSI
jgi:hypothetical protein